MNIEDTLFAGAVVEDSANFTINCDASNMAAAMYREAAPDLFGFMKKHNASHYHRLSSFGLEKISGIVSLQIQRLFCPVYQWKTGFR